MSRRWTIRVFSRSIRTQLLVGLVVLEAMSLLLFGLVILRQQNEEIRSRVTQRLAHESESMALQVDEALKAGSWDQVRMSVRMMGKGPSVEAARVTDPTGKVLFASDGADDWRALGPDELAQKSQAQEGGSHVFRFGKDAWEAVHSVHQQGKLWGYAWVETDRSWDKEQLNLMLRSTAIFGLIWIGASIVLALWLSYTITKPLGVLHAGTRALMLAPETAGGFPLPVVTQNEIGDLIEAFNRMVASLEEQRAGLNDTLSLLDSMLANAPIGLAFFDGPGRFVRVNRIFAEMNGLPVSRLLGRTKPEVLPAAVAGQLEHATQRVFAENVPVRDVEVTGTDAGTGQLWTWIVSAYPIRGATGQVRWVGVIVLDASDRKRSEEALRKTEKLAATGRLAASIAHEINNPLEAITNLLYLLSNHSGLEEPALGYVQMAEDEVKRIAEITQQTLRFYRQSTQAARASLEELLDSVLSLHQVRLGNKGIRVEREYEPGIDLYCFAGELRQVFANLIANAIDAMPEGGHLMVRAWRSRCWQHTDIGGIRFVVADTGVGMTAAVRRRVFEAFFTTKEVTGTGLGLWVSYEIIEKSRGRIRVKSRVSRDGVAGGTVFMLFVPDLEPITEKLVQGRIG